MFRIIWSALAGGATIIRFKLHLRSHQSPAAAVIWSALGAFDASRSAKYITLWGTLPTLSSLRRTVRRSRHTHRSIYMTTKNGRVISVAGYWHLLAALSIIVGIFSMKLRWAIVVAAVGE